MGKQLPGIQSFALSDIEEMVPTHKEPNNPVVINNENDVTKSENSSNHQLNGNLLILVESTPAEEEGVVEVDEVAIGEDTRIIVIIKVLLLRFMLLNKQFNSW